MTALLFAACLFISPLAGVVPPQATGAVLVLVGFLMMREVGSLPWGDLSEATRVPRADRHAVHLQHHERHRRGVRVVAVLKVLAGRGREVRPLMFAAAGAFLLYFVVA